MRAKLLRWLLMTVMITTTTTATAKDEIDQCANEKWKRKTTRKNNLKNNFHVWNSWNGNRVTFSTIPFCASLPSLSLSDSWLFLSFLFSSLSRLHGLTRALALIPLHHTTYTSWYHARSLPPTATQTFLGRHFNFLHRPSVYCFASMSKWFNKNLRFLHTMFIPCSLSRWNENGK